MSAALVETLDDPETTYWTDVALAAGWLAENDDRASALHALADGDTGLTVGGSLCWAGDLGRRVWEQDDHDLIAELVDGGLIDGLRVTDFGRDVLEALREQETG